MYIQQRQSDNSFSSSTSSTMIALIVCLVFIGVSAILGVSIYYYRSRRNNPGQTPVPIDSSMPTMKITFLSPPSSTSSPIRMELVPASTVASQDNDCQPVHPGHSRLGLSGANGGSRGMCCEMSVEDHRTRSILSDDASFDEGTSDWNQVQNYEPFSPNLSPDNRRFGSFEPSSVKGMNALPSALGLDTGLDLSRTMSMSSGSFCAHYPSRQPEDSAHHVHRHSAQPGFTRSVSFGAYGEPMARPRLSTSHSHSYSHQSYGSPSFYRFTSAPPQTSPVSSEESPSDLLPSSPSMSYHRPTIPKHQRSLSLPDALPFTPSSSPLTTKISHFARSPSSTVSPLPPSLHGANSNSIPPLMRQTKAMEFDPTGSGPFTCGYLDDPYRRSIEHPFRNGPSEDYLIKPRMSSVAVTGLDHDSRLVWDRGGARLSRDLSQEREEDGGFLDRMERLPPGYEQSEESFNESIMV